jgi:hypothetical protein
LLSGWVRFAYNGKITGFTGVLGQADWQDTTVQNNISSRRASTGLCHYHNFRLGSRLSCCLAITGLVSGLIASCVNRSISPLPTATQFLTRTPGVTIVPYTQDVPGIQATMAGSTDWVGNQVTESIPSGTPAPATPFPTGKPTTNELESSTPAAANPVSTPTSSPRMLPKYWREWPVVPTVSARARQVYQNGLQMGNNPRSFSRVGDCQSVPAIFMGIYDDKERYWLGEDYEYLQETIDQFSGSFSRQSVTAKDGFGVASVLSPLMADPDVCRSDESPIQCEFRIHKPILVFVAMGTNWAPGAEISFENYLRQIVDFSIEHGTVPVLVTKGDNIEKDFKLNEAIARVAYDYDMPLFNAWRAIQFLHNHGLEDNGVYLTIDAWNVRDFTGLQTLDSIWRGINGIANP